MAPNDGHQLCLPLTGRRPEPAIADAGDVVIRQRRPNSHKLPAEFTEFKPGEPLRGSHDVYAHFRERLASETREHFYAVPLDNKHRKQTGDAWTSNERCAADL